MNTKYLGNMGSIIVAKQYEETLHSLQTLLCIEMEFSTTGKGNPNALLVTTDYHALKDELCRKYPTDFILELLLHMDIVTPEMMERMKPFVANNVWCNNKWFHHVPQDTHEEALDLAVGELLCIYQVTHGYLAKYYNAEKQAILSLLL